MPLAPADLELDLLLSGGMMFSERYRILRILKRGNGVQTALALDETQNQRVIIKTASTGSLSVGAQMRLEHEAAVLRQIQSPYIAPLVEFGRRDDMLFLVMPFLPGLTLQDRIKREALSVADTLTIGRCLMKALEDVHEHGVLHRDLKPGNIIVDDPLSRATVIDFGLARSARLDASIRDQPVGTARYMAPEQAGLLDQEADERSDLYSAGVVLFECLAGRAPFHAESVGEVLRQHMTLKPPELRSLGIPAPRALDEVIQRLLRKDPRDRYQSAEAVRADLDQIAAALEKGIADPPLVVGLRDRRRSLTEPAFVGRDADLAALDVQLDLARLGEGGLIFLEAESGGGKTRLLSELAQRSARGGCRVFRGQALDQAAQRPFQVLVGVAAELMQAGGFEPRFSHHVQSRLGEQSEAVCAALPELVATLGVASTGVLGPETFGEARSLQALAALLDSLGAPERPALILLDDCQWADEATLKLLAAWQRRRDPSHVQPRHTLVVVAFRSEDVPAGHRLRGLSPHGHLRLPPFQPRDIRRLAESMAGPLPDTAVAVVEELAQGSPFMAAAVLQGFVESGALVAEASGWRVEPLALAGVQSSRHAAAFLVRRMELLPPAVLSFLSAGAVLGKDFDLDFAATLAQQTPVQAVAALDEARRRHIIWAKTGETRCSFIHDKLRQTLLERLAPEVREDFHRRAALYLESQAADRVFDLAYHFDAAGLHQKALPYALAAAEQARARHALEVAEQQYRIAERGATAEDQTTRFRIAEGLGDVFMLRGRYDQAAAQFEVALGLAEGELAQAEIEGKLGELAFKRGDIGVATARIEQAVRQLGRRVPRWSFTFVVMVLWEAIVQFFHCLCPRFFLGRKKLEGFAKERLALRLYSRLAHLYWFHRGAAAALWAHLRELNRAERYPPTPELAQAYSEHAPGMTLLAWFGRGIAYAEKSLAMRKQFGDLWGQGQSLHFYGIVLYAASRFDDAIARCREAVRLLERTGDFWEVNIARFQIAASLYHRGDFAGALAEARRMHQSGQELGDAQASGISLDVWARAALGRIPAQIIQAEMERSTGDVQRNAQVLLAEGVRLFYAKQADKASEVLERARDQIAAAGIRNAWVAPILPWLATALRTQAQETSALTPGKRAELLRRAWRAARQGLRITRKFRNNYPHALRECGLLLAIMGKPARAYRYFERSVAVAQEQGAVYERAQTLLARAQVGVELGREGAAAELEEARQILRPIEEAAIPSDGPAGSKLVTLSLADRFDTVLDCGRRIASALSKQAIYQTMREAALKLLRGERCIVLKLEERTGQEEDFTLVSGEVEAEFSRAIIKESLQAGHAVTLVEGLSDQSSESVLLAGVRSALCAPVFVRGKPAGCFYVTHRQVAGLFGEDEERLADFIATLAGAALENAEGFDKLRGLNETLEVQIEESRRAEKRIQEQAALLDKARDAISVQDLEGRILYWNQSSERLYGWPAAEAVGKRADDLLHVGLAPALAEAQRLVLQRGEWVGELEQVTREGKEIVVESRWTLVRDEQARPKAKLVVSTDVTEKKRLEAHFLRAQRMESLGTLAGGIAHDINNVLLPIMMSVDLLKRELPQEQRLAILTDLESSAQRGADMVKQILSFARGVEGKKAPVQLRHVIGEMAKMLHRTFPKSIQFGANLPRDLWIITGDPTQLYQMVMNLCVNARDAMPAGGRLDLDCANVFLTDPDAGRLHPDAKAGPYVKIQVTDSGVGIPPAVLDKIFDPFFTTKEFGKGTGLGLSTVLGIVKGHGGFIQVESKIGVGAQFTIYLPASEGGPLHASEKEDTEPKGRGETVLVVDDEPAICMITQKNLEAHGYRVLTARNGLEAMRLVNAYRGKVQVVVTDMMMPGMDGAATLKALKKIDPHLRMIAASGLETVREGAQAAGFQGFLLKPFKVDNLLRTVSDVLRQ